MGGRGARALPDGEAFAVWWRIERGNAGVSDRPVIYSGQGLSQRGDKDRFVLPPAFRKAVTEGATSKAGAKPLFYVAKHHKWQCLVGFGETRREGLLAEIDRDYELALKAGQPFDRDERMFQMFDCHEVGFDPSGRHVLPRHLRDLVAIGDTVFFQGSGLWFTLWAPDVLMAQAGPQWASAQAACASLMAEPAGRGRK